MIKFKEYFLSEGKRFRNDNFIHLMDVPMFSIFIESKLSENKNLMNVIKKNNNLIRKMFEDARYNIHSIGFPSQHVNFIIMEGKEGDYALYSPKNRAIYFKYDEFSNTEKLISGKKHITETIVHEWAHAWMFNKGKKFREVILKIYKEKRKQYNPKISDVVDFKGDAHKHSDIIVKKISSKFYPSDVVKIVVKGKAKNITLKNFELFPHGSSIRSLSTGQGNYVNIYGQSINIPENSKVTVNKFHDGNLHIDYFAQNNQRYSLDSIPVKDISKYVHETPSSILIKFRNTLKTIDLNDLLEYYRSDLLRRLPDAFSESVKSLNVVEGSLIKLTPEAKEVIQQICNEMVNTFIIPYLLQQLKSETIDNIIKDAKEPYNWLWMNNTIKQNSNITLRDYFEKVLQSCKVEHDINCSLRGTDCKKDKDKILLRYAYQLAKVWYSQYGMSNEDELWATAIEGFFKLPDKDKRIIINLINNS